jgi:hypothetical protein
MDPLLVLEVLAAGPIGCALGYLVYVACEAIGRYGPPAEAREASGPESENSGARAAPW